VKSLKNNSTDNYNIKRGTGGEQIIHQEIESYDEDIRFRITVTSKRWGERKQRAKGAMKRGRERTTPPHLKGWKLKKKKKKKKKKDDAEDRIGER
jgi:hypothetical protein